MEFQLNSNYHEVTRLDDYDYTSNILITDEELDRELEAVNEAYRVFEENEENRVFEENEENRVFEENEETRVFEENEETKISTLRQRNKYLKNSNVKNTGDIIKIHRNTKTIYLTRFAFISLLLAANMFAYYFSINQHKFIKLIKN